MADISRIALPSGTTYDISDEKARSDIEQLKQTVGGAVTFLGNTSTAIHDGSGDTTVKLGEANHTAQNGDVVIYGSSEFVYADSDGKWHEFGSTGALKALAFKSSATGSVIPAGTVTAPAISVALNTTSITPMQSVGSLPSATLPSFSASVSNETLSLGWSAGSFNAGSLPTVGTAVTVATGVKSASASAPAFSGKASSVTVM